MLVSQRFLCWFLLPVSFLAALLTYADSIDPKLPIRIFFRSGIGCNSVFSWGIWRAIVWRSKFRKTAKQYQTMKKTVIFGLVLLQNGETARVTYNYLHSYNEIFHWCPIIYMHDCLFCFFSSLVYRMVSSVGFVASAQKPAERPLDIWNVPKHIHVAVQLYKCSSYILHR